MSSAFTGTSAAVSGGTGTCRSIVWDCGLSDSDGSCISRDGSIGRGSIRSDGNSEERVAIRLARCQSRSLRASLGTSDGT